MKGIEGNDGRLYYNYGVGARFKLYLNGREVTEIKIADCIYDYLEDTEKYLLEIEGQETELLYGKTRMESLLKYGQAEEVDCGVAKEYPLMKEEVRLYYEWFHQSQNSARNEAEKFMELTTGYKALKKQCIELGNLIAKAISEERENVDVLLKRYSDVKEKLRQMICGKGKDPKLFEPERQCPDCLGTGITPRGRICRCAWENEEKIKRWNAEERLKRRFGETWAVRLHEGDEVGYGSRIPAEKHIEQSGPGQLERGKNNKLLTDECR